MKSLGILDQNIARNTWQASGKHLVCGLFERVCLKGLGSQAKNAPDIEKTVDL